MSAWETYLDKPYHDLLPRLAEENQKWVEVMGRLMVDRTHTQYEVFDPDGAVPSRWTQGHLRL